MDIGSRQWHVREPISMRFLASHDWDSLPGFRNVEAAKLIH